MVNKWTIIRHSGKPEMLWGDTGTLGSPSYSYLSMLEWVYRDISGGGSSYDAPNILYADGKLVMDGGLTDAAWKYVEELRKERDKVVKEVNDKHDRSF